MSGVSKDPGTQSLEMTTEANGNCDFAVWAAVSIVKILPRIRLLSPSLQDSDTISWSRLMFA